MKFKEKRLLSLILCVAMMLASVGSTYVYAENKDNHDHESKSVNAVALADSDAGEAPTITITPSSSDSWEGGNTETDVYCGAPTVRVYNADSVTVVKADGTEESHSAGESFVLNAPQQVSSEGIAYTIKAKNSNGETVKNATVYYMHWLAGRREYIYEDSCTVKANNMLKYLCKYCGTYYVPWSENTYRKSGSSGELHELETKTEQGCDGLTYTISRCKRENCNFVEVSTSGEPNGGIHTWKPVDKPATCVNDGISYEECEKCHAIRNVTVTYAIGHNIGGWGEHYTDNDCTKGGTYNSQCALCKKSFSKELKPSPSHTGVWKTTKAATCKEEGEQTRKCSRNGCNVVETERIPSKGVEHVYTNNVTKTPTCTEQGIRTYTCTICGDTYTEPIEPIDGPHTYQVHSVKSPTCNTTGTKTYKCSKCGDTYDETIAATGKHVYKDDNNCETEDVCSVCGTVVNKASQHEFGDYYTKPYDKNNHYRNCNKCSYVEQKAHYGEDDGLCTTALNCTACNALIKAAQPNHLPYDAKHVAPLPGQEELYHSRICKHEGCTYQYMTGFYVSRHTFVDNKCTECGYVLADHVHKYGNDYLSDETGHWHVCTVCGVRSEVEPHDKSAETGYEGSCHQAVRCSTCSYEVLPAHTTHSLSDGWHSDSEHHYKICTRKGCSYRDEYDHTMIDDDRNCTTPSVCSICHAQSVTGGQQHSWAVKEGSGTAYGHIRECTNPDCDFEELVAHEAGIAANCKDPAECWLCHTKFGSTNPDNHVGGEEIRNAKEATTTEEGYTGDVYCLGCNQIKTAGSVIPRIDDSHEHNYSGYLYDGEKHWHVCTVCNAKLEGSDTNHTFDPYVNEGDTHSRTCSVCGYKDEEAHDHSAEDYNCETALECVDCGAVIIEAQTHNFNGRAEGDKTGHWVACTNRNCRHVSETVEHIGGMASCTSGKHCEVCGVEYSDKDPNYHTGGTELRGHKNATTTEEGYTGDTYCLGCGELILKGKTIEKLPAEHEHRFGDWIYDETHHWRECECGDWDGYGEHTFEKGICTVCGAADPTYIPSESDPDAIYGDVNGDGKITVDDVTLIQKAIVFLVKFDENTTMLADVNNDGLVNILDVTLIQKYIVKLNYNTELVGKPVKTN